MFLMRLRRRILSFIGSLAIFGSVVTFLIIPSLTLIVYSEELTDKDRIIRKNDRGIILTDRDNVPFFRLEQGRITEVVPLEKISQNMIQSVVAMEDRSYWDHKGISLRGISRAFATNISQGRIVAGGSTITQQLVKNTMLAPNKSYIRKYIEAILAVALERNFNKSEIMEMYLNTVYFGQSAYGIADAAKHYFNTTPEELTIAQAATLTGFLTAPTQVSGDPGLVSRNQHLVVDTLLDLKKISEEEAQKIKDTPIEFAEVSREDKNILAPHFALAVSGQVQAIIGEDHPPVIVKTTLDRKIQEFAEDALDQHVQRIRRQGAGNGAVVVIEPSSGEILAYAGSFDWSDPSYGKVDMAASPRSPGSAFKPFVYALAFEKNIMTPATMLPDKPVTYGTSYKPRNYDGRFRGNVLARRALANSLNVPSLAVMEKVSVPTVLNFLQSLGFSTLKDPKDLGISLVLGTNEVPLFELTNAYGVFANYGMYTPHTTILSIKNAGGDTLYEQKQSSRRVLSEDSAFLITSILTDNRSRSEQFGGMLDTSVDAAVKTGTSEGYRDSVTVGYTSNTAVGVWVGNNDNTPMQRLTGSLGAAPLWKTIIQKVSGWRPPEKFRKPDDIVERQVCFYRRLETGDTTPSAYTEYFSGDMAPRESCVLNQPEQPAVHQEETVTS